jgi:RNA polymerase sigma-70 factor (ECF subfamily)
VNPAGPSQADRAVAGDPEAVRALWESSRRWVAAVALAHMPRSARSGDPDLEDLLQEIALRMVRTIHTVRDPALVKPWLRTIAVNVARTAGRRRVPRVRLIREESPSAPMDQIVEPTAPASGVLEEGRRVMAAAQRLPAEYREPLFLRCVRGMSYRQIADAMGVPVTTVETRLARARRMVREELGEEEATPSDARNGPESDRPRA